MQTPITHKKGQLYFDTIRLRKIADKLPTPFYLYSEHTLIENYKNFLHAAQDANLPAPLICFALKANPNPYLLKKLAKEGAGADIVSGGELARATESGISRQKIVFSGVGKTLEEIEKGLMGVGIYSFNVESLEELEMINSVAKRLKKCARVAFRFNPEVHAKTHKHISTGFKSHKFGLLRKDILKALKTKSLWSHVKLVGLSVHIGSQLTCLKATGKAMRELGMLAREINMPLEFLDVGGGLGIDYAPSDKNTYQTPNDYMQVISKNLQKTYLKDHTIKHLVFEPGRVISARAGCFITSVIRTKKSGGQCFVIVDGGMNDFVRTSLYGAYHEILVNKKPGRKINSHVVGPICETADCFATDRMLPPLQPNDLVCVADVGAYGFSMASMYNMRKLPKEVVVTKSGKITIT